MQADGFTLIELMIVVAIIGLLAAIAVPNFLRFQARSKQGEAKVNLRAWFTAERAFFQEKDRYSEDIFEVGFSPERGNRYFYRVAVPGLSNQARSATGLISGPYGGVEADTYKFGAGTPPTYTPVNQALTFASTPPASPGISGPCPGCEIDGFAAGNIDNDSAGGGIDTWIIASVDGTATAGCGNVGALNVPAGTPYLTNDDVECE